VAASKLASVAVAGQSNWRSERSAALGHQYVTQSILCFHLLEDFNENAGISGALEVVCELDVTGFVDRWGAFGSEVGWFHVSLRRKCSAEMIFSSRCHW
jgi:hypothetical protein